MNKYATNHDTPSFDYRICENCNSRCESPFCLRFNLCAQIHSEGRTNGSAQAFIPAFNKRLAEIRKGK